MDKNYTSGFEILGDKIGFEGQEVYNLLRTNLLLSFGNEKKCKKVGITSAMHQDGKSVTAINTSYTLAMAGYKVLLIEGDLRLPTISSNLGISISPGLSNYLAGGCKKEVVIKKNVLIENLDIASGGDIPPNPSELLDSELMKNFLEDMSEIYQFILIDMPPVSAVSDAIIVSPILDGTLVVVVRYRYTDKTLLFKIIRQFQNVDAKIIGFVLNNHLGDEKKYYKNYKKYYKKSED